MATNAGMGGFATDRMGITMIDLSNFIAPGRNGPMSLRPAHDVGSKIVPVTLRGPGKGFSGTITYEYQHGMLVGVRQERETDRG